MFNLNLIKKGYTLIEIILVISLIAIVAASTFPITKTFLDRNEYDSAFRLVLNGIRTAQIFSQTGKSDTNWGVRFNSGSVVVFSGTSYATRTTNLDEVSSISTRISVSGTTEIVFNKVTGYITSNVTVTISGNNISKNIIVNTKGLPIY